MIGITAVILSVGIGNGTKAQVRDQINELGTNVLVVSPGSTTSTSGVRGGFGSSSTLTVQDAQALTDRTVAPDIETVAGTSTTNASLSAGSTNWTTQLVGTTPSWQQVRSRDGDDRPVHHRRRHPERGQRRRARSGHRVGTVRWTQRGRPDGDLQRHARSKSSACCSRSNHPRTRRTTTWRSFRTSTYAERLVGGQNRNSVSSIYVKATSADTVSAAYQETDALLLNLHGLDVGDQRRLLHRHPAVDPGCGDDRGQDDEPDARRHRDHLAARRRHRRHEHHAGVGHRADPRDRSSQVTRRAAATHPPSVPGGGEHARLRRRCARRR